MPCLPLALVIALLCASNVSVGQANVIDMRLLEVDEEGERTYHNVVLSHTFKEGRFSMEAFCLNLPQLDYDEVGAGVGYRIATVRDIKLSLIAYLSAADDDGYLEPALLAVKTTGRVTGSCLLLHYFPLGTDGVHQWLVDPLEIQVVVRGPLSLGVSSYFYRPAGGSWLRKIGPKLSIADRLGATELAVRDVNQGGGAEFQLRRIFVF